MFNEICTSYVIWEGINLSPHQAVLLYLKVKCVVSGVNVGNDQTPERKVKLAWYRASDQQLNQYKRNLDHLLQHITVPDELLNCDGIHCRDEAHEYGIDLLGDELVQCCLIASQKSIPICNSKKSIPKWNDSGKPAYNTALFWHSIWISCGKPNTGWVYEIRIRTRAQYHRVVKDLKKRDMVNRSEKMAEAILRNDNRDFWTEARKINPKKKLTTNTIDGITGDGSIAELLAQKYNYLYNSVPYKDK